MNLGAGVAIESRGKVSKCLPSESELWCNRDQRDLAFKELVSPAMT